MVSSSKLKALGFAGVALASWSILGLCWCWSTALAFGLYLATGGWKFTKIVIATLPRDIKGLYALLVIKKKMSEMVNNDYNMLDIFDETVKRHPNKKAIIMANGEEMTFAEVQKRSYQIANWVCQKGYNPGDCMALFMLGCPEYLCWWLGMARVSVVPALINFNLRSESLVHCIKVAEAKGVVFGVELAEAIQDVQASLEDIQLYSRGGSSPAPGTNIVDELNATTANPPVPSRRPRHTDRLFYIYTSGTTGMPKAAVIKHYRFYYMAFACGTTIGVQPDDVIYDTLPLYHSAGGILGPGQCLIKGATLVVRPKFSASNFWTECIKYKCTIGQYIGETCRYLLAQPVKPTDRQHCVRKMLGNGIRPQIWKEFQNRFNIDYIMEFYGATEGNSNIINYPGKVGAIGFTTRIAPSLFPVSLIKLDNEGKPLRDKQGMCIHCQPGEPGELVGKIGKEVIRRFDGYVGAKETQKKIADNVFVKGDRAFLTGDVLEMDDYGFFYFKDRSGDTFRWKGENCSTLEVEGVLHNIVHYRDAVVYGVEVPGNEGRAGMAAIANDDSLDLVDIYKQLQTALPAYARPVFIRLLDKVDTTGTFKLIKKNYIESGFNPSLTTDAMYYLDARAGAYKPIDKNVYEQICKGEIRL